jgi:Trk K+ transport system NAD-binding subunit
MLDNQARRAKIETTNLRRATHSHVHEIVLSMGDYAVGKTLAELKLPTDYRIISIHRSGRTVIPHGETEMRSGDHLAVLSIDEEDARLDRMVKKGAENTEGV